MKISLTEEAKTVIFPLIVDGKIAFHSPETLLDCLTIYDKMYGKSKAKVKIWKFVGLTATAFATIFAKKWCDEVRKNNLLEDEIAFIKDDLFEEDINDIKS